LIAFLERAQMPRAGEEHSLFFYVYGLAHPKRLWDTFEWRFEEPDKHRYVTLFLANLGPSHPDGLAFDQKTNKAIMQMSIHDASITLNGRTPWLPLEVILSAWLDMVDVGKVRAVDDSVEANEKFDPWICCHWNQGMVQETVKAFNALLDSIESRMEDQGFVVTDSKPPLLPDATLEAAGIPNGFARSFFTQPRRPGFRYIAPDISIPSPGSFLQQPFSSIMHDEQDEDPDEDELIIEPILLFASSSHVSLANEEDKYHPFPWPYNQLLSFPAGLYLTDSERSAGHEFEDGVKFVLPYGVGGKGFARTSDGLHIDLRIFISKAGILLSRCTREATGKSAQRGLRAALMLSKRLKHRKVGRGLLRSRPMPYHNQSLSRSTGTPQSINVLIQHRSLSLL
ncbi:hypothetical protein KCV00_g1, partial [Aureobasidium melanogenum]